VTDEPRLAPLSCPQCGRAVAIGTGEIAVRLTTTKARGPVPRVTWNASF
jgi:hypothetical protein